MATETERDGKIVCRECGRAFSFLAPHLRMAHEMPVSEYRERWGIAKHVPLASAEHSAKCQENVLRRIGSGELDPDLQVRMMAEGYARVKDRGRPSALKKKSSSRTATTHRIWETSPAIKRVSGDLKREAVRRMKTRVETAETVREIADELKLSPSCLYRWQAEAG
ncbi:MucR family transcriptional regulator [Enterobacter huaxiensis]|uniref:MucR family transcriptional regulator n=1 Tax=Enterobacter huaxiensis TaxID=2494702 RepID=UPI000E73D2D6|nr:MucR family transcriptional regulator [Enterobacter huaxiensis]UNC52601.1 ROS/MUCR transcriptional regulator domain protein [Enterobacter huaxiensis]